MIPKGGFLAGTRMEEKYYAHSLLNEPPEKWQPLEDHLKNVANKLRAHTLNEKGNWHGIKDRSKEVAIGLWHDFMGRRKDRHRRRGTVEDP
jgi:hypothetical protein